MRLLYSSFLLLFAMQGLADAQQRFLRPLSGFKADIYLVVDTENPLDDEAQTSVVELLEQQVSVYADQLSLHILHNNDWPNYVKAQAANSCRKQYVLLFLQDGQSISEYKYVLEQLAEQGIATTVLSAYNDETWQAHALVLGVEQPWIALEEAPKLAQRLHRWLQHVYYGRSQQAMPASMQSLTVANGIALLSYSKATTTERWWSDSLLFDAQREEITDKQGKTVLAIDGSLKHALGLYPSISRMLQQQDDAPLWIDNGVSIENIAAIASQQWLMYFRLSSVMQQQLQAYYTDSGQQLTLQHLLASLQGRDIDQKRLLYPLADVQHSKPLVIDYGHLQHDNAQWLGKANPYRAIILVTNDGSLHSLDATLADNAETNDVLQQRFVIKPSMFLDQQVNRLWNTGKSPHIAHLDAELSAVIVDQWKLAGNQQGHIDGDDKAWLYMSMGRGGKAVYRYDISHPFRPKVAGHIRQQAGGDFAELGLTFAKPIAIITQWQQQAQASLLLAAGYDTAYDMSDSNATSILAKEGHAIFLIHAESAKLVWKAKYGEQEQAGNQFYQHPAMRYAIAAAPSILAAKYPHFSDNAYVGDVAGQVWHIHLPACQAEQCADSNFRQKYWSVKRLAAFSGQAKEQDIRFFHSPAVWQNANSPFIALASGNREAPLENKTQNYLFVIQPDNALIQTSDLPLLKNCLEAACAADRGWKMALALGEKPLSSPVYYQGYLYLNTYQSQLSKCRWSEDSYRLYRIALKDAASVTRLDTMVLPATSVFRLIDDNNIALLAPKIADYLRQLDGNEESDDDGQSAPDTVLKNHGIVIHSWREKNN